MHRLKLLPLVLILGVTGWAGAVRQVAMLDLPGRPGFGELAFAKGILVIAHPAASTVDIFDPAKRRLIGQVKDMSLPRGIVVSGDGTAVYIANSGANNIVVLDTETWQVRRMIPVEGSPESLLLLPNSNVILACLPASKAVAAIDLSRGQQVAKIDLTGRPEYLAFDTSRKITYVTIQDHQEIVGFNETMEPVRRFKVNGSLPTGLVYDDKSDRFYVAVRYAILVLDGNTGKEVARVPVAGGINQLLLDGNSHNLFGGSNGALFVVKTDGSGRNLEEVAVEVKGHTLAFDASRKLIYVPGGREGRSKMLILKQVNGGEPAEVQKAQSLK